MKKNTPTELDEIYYMIEIYKEDLKILYEEKRKYKTKPHIYELKLMDVERRIRQTKILLEDLLLIIDQEFVYVTNINGWYNYTPMEMVDYMIDNGYKTLIIDFSPSMNEIDLSEILDNWSEIRDHYNKINRYKDENRY